LVRGEQKSLGFLGGIPMPVLTIEYQDEAERLGLEQAIAFFLQMRQTAQTAPEGTVLAACEQVAVNQGRAFLRNSLAAAVQSRVASAEQKGGLPAPKAARAPRPRATKGGTSARP
jgi:hypothetical protein